MKHRKKETAISPEMLARWIDYNPESGAMLWRFMPTSAFSDGAQSAEHNRSIWNGKFARTAAFSYLGENGYFIGSFKGFAFKAHRVAFAIYHGKWPVADIDHINRIRTDNRIFNLREATRSENMRNKCIPEANKSGVVGVSWYATRVQWNAKIGINGKQKNLGYFDDFEAAVTERLKAEVNYWGAVCDANKKAILRAQGIEIVEV